MAKFGAFTGRTSEDDIAAKKDQKTNDIENRIYTNNSYPETAITDVQSLPGIAVAKGLTVWTDVTVYRKFLLKFATDYVDSVRNLSRYFSEKNYTEANALAHKLKGTAGNLALPEIAHISGEIESVGLNVDTSNYPSDALARLQTALDTAIVSILLFAVEKNNQTIIAPDVVDVAQATKLLPELMRALDTDAPDQALTLLDDLATVFPLAALDSVRTRIDDFDFRGAEILVRQLANQWGITVEE